MGPIAYRFSFAVLVGVLCAGAGAASAQMQRSSSAVAADIDPQIRAVIDTTLAIDNHAHPVLPPPADGTDRNFDALPVDGLEPQTDPVAWRADNPQLAAAWLALWGFRGVPPLDDAAMKRLDAARAAAKQREGGNYANWVLAQAGTSTMLGNRVSMRPEPGEGGPGLTSPHFRWVPYIDPLILPLDNAGMAAVDPDRAKLLPLEDKLRARLLREASLTAMPPTLDGYVQSFLLSTLQRLHAQGAVAFKFEAAYLRSLDFAEVPQARAATVYAQWIAGGVAPATDYKALQDYLFHQAALEAGRLGVPIHLHCIAGGDGYYQIANGSPMLLEPLFNDPALRKTKFVMLHAGWPYVREATSLLQKPNAYLDLSQESLLFSPRVLAGFLRERLELFPDKVLFGTDGYPYSGAMGWEESTWMAAQNARAALGLALTAMVRDGVIDEARAAKYARMVLRENAEAVYGKW